MRADPEISASKVVVAKAASCAQFARVAIEDPTRGIERAWLAREAGRRLGAGGILDRFLVPAPRALCRVRALVESERLRRALRGGEPVYALDVEALWAAWRDLRLAGDRGEGREAREVLDWLLCLREADAALFGKLGRVTLRQAVDHAARWHEALDARRRREAEEAEGALLHFVRREGARRVPEAPCRIVFDEFHLAARGASRPPWSWPGAAASSPPRAEVLLRSGGFSWIRLLNPAALDRESERMGHCVGYGAYDRGVGSGNAWILTLVEALGEDYAAGAELPVDAWGAPGVCTAEWRPGERDLAQVKGPGNGAVPEAARPALRALLEHLQPARAPGRDLAANGLRWVGAEGGDPGRVEACDPALARSPGRPAGGESGAVLLWDGGLLECLRLDVDPPAAGLRRGVVAVDQGPVDSLVGSHYVDRARGFMSGLLRHLAESGTGPEGGSESPGAAARASGRTESGARARPYPWRRRCPGLDELRAIARNPRASVADREEARLRLEGLLARG